MHDKTCVIASRVLDGKGVYSQASISIMIPSAHTLSHFELSVHYLLCTECLWLDQGKLFTQEKIVSAMLPLSCSVATVWHNKIF